MEGFVFTTMTTATAIPAAIGGSGTYPVISTAGFVVGQTVRIKKAVAPSIATGTFTITSISAGVSITGTFLGVSGDSAVGTTIGVGAMVILVSDPISYQSCSIDSVLVASTCYQNACLSDQVALGLMVYARVKALAAAGGTDYSASIASLETAAAKWRILNQEQRDQVELFATITNANLNGAAISTGANALRLAAVCYTCLPVETQKNLLAYLRCLINSRGLAA